MELLAIIMLFVIIIFTYGVAASAQTVYLKQITDISEQWLFTLTLTFNGGLLLILEAVSLEIGPVVWFIAMIITIYFSYKNTKDEKMKFITLTNPTPLGIYTRADIQDIKGNIDMYAGMLYGDQITVFMSGDKVIGHTRGADITMEHIRIERLIMTYKNVSLKEIVFSDTEYLTLGVDMNGHLRPLPKTGYHLPVVHSILGWGFLAPDGKVYDFDLEFEYPESAYINTERVVDLKIAQQQTFTDEDDKFRDHCILYVGNSICEHFRIVTTSVKGW